IGASNIYFFMGYEFFLLIFRNYLQVIVTEPWFERNEEDGSPLTTEIDGKIRLLSFLAARSYHRPKNSSSTYPIYFRVEWIRSGLCDLAGICSERDLEERMTTTSLHTTSTQTTSENSKENGNSEDQYETLAFYIFRNVEARVEDSEMDSKEETNGSWKWELHLCMVLVLLEYAFYRHGVQRLMSLCVQLSSSPLRMQLGDRFLFARVTQSVAAPHPQSSPSQVQLLEGHL
ncbi:Protein CBG13607, partial [Caenorhabditis briggsae]